MAEEQNTAALFVLSSQSLSVTTHHRMAPVPDNQINKHTVNCSQPLFVRLVHRQTLSNMPNIVCYYCKQGARCGIFPKLRGYAHP